MEFICKKCGNKSLYEMMEGVAVESECYFDDDGNLCYGDQSNTDGEVIGYQCGNGHWITTPCGCKALSAEELIQAIKDLNT